MILPIRLGCTSFYYTPLDEQELLRGEFKPQATRDVVTQDNVVVKVKFCQTCVN